MPKRPKRTDGSTRSLTFPSNSRRASASAGRPAKKRSHVKAVFTELSSTSYEGSLGFGKNPTTLRPVVQVLRMSPAVVTKMASQDSMRRAIWLRQCSVSTGSQLMCTMRTPGHALRAAASASFVT